MGLRLLRASTPNADAGRQRWAEVTTASRYHPLRSTSNCMEQTSDQKTKRRRAEADQDHLQSALTPVSNKSLCRIDTHGEERHCAQRYRQDNSRRACDHHEGNDWYEMTDEGRDGYNHGALHQALLGNGLQMQLFIHHRIHPGFTIGSDGGNNILEKLSLETLSSINLSDFFALVIWFRFDLCLLAIPLGDIEVAV